MLVLLLFARLLARLLVLPLLAKALLLLAKAVP